MENQGWSAEMNEKQEFCLPEPMKSRYTGYPESWMRFVSIVKSMVRKDERAWFLCGEDYDMQGDKAWQWNEWELLSLDAAGDDAVWKEEIRQFWDGHLPFFLSLEGGYAYYAFSLEDGSVVHGDGRSIGTPPSDKSSPLRKQESAYCPHGCHGNLNPLEP